MGVVFSDSLETSLVLYTKGFSIHDIHARLEIFVSKKTLYRLLKKYRSESTIPTCIGLQIYEGQIIKTALVGWLAAVLLRALSTRLFPKPFLGRGERKLV